MYLLYFAWVSQMLEDYPTSAAAVYFLHMSGSLLAFFLLCLVSVIFSAHP